MNSCTKFVATSCFHFCSITQVSDPHLMLLAAKIIILHFNRFRSKSQQTKAEVLRYRKAKPITIHNHPTTPSHRLSNPTDESIVWSKTATPNSDCILPSHHYPVRPPGFNKKAQEVSCEDWWEAWGDSECRELTLVQSTNCRCQRKVEETDHEFQAENFLAKFPHHNSLDINLFVQK